MDSGPDTDQDYVLYGPECVTENEILKSSYISTWWFFVCLFFLSRELIVSSHSYTVNSYTFHLPDKVLNNKPRQSATLKSAEGNKSKKMTVYRQNNVK